MKKKLINKIVIYLVFSISLLSINSKYNQNLNVIISNSEDDNGEYITPDNVKIRNYFI
ncbi:hypothetical protein ACWOAQ_08000 [Helcococcus kunzii]|uniref:Uncharacterized protein n=1 Tax=Helcococcus kunzii ATCC 51366 TaxID=883114 RepID=H3NME3_9FIRM|nr:hypothetical protein [Helcococcus kunzii]EHR35078.1 hypothetical protein HMPREF9709_00504 [Helcococcus kunzii ATCC 51366]MCT1796055.1 hypothetical protein [Helcococcus kunzii]MCT1988604.1 hypothetical protein [Helcococcus kunzii]QUY64455.1 hypothetical protein GUI37_02610 [Helcococcus kunzii]QZO76866.1 hypothetical protein HIF96_02290 [Helcococcus kunzii]